MREARADPRSFDSFAGDYDRYCDLHDPLGEWLGARLTELALGGARALDAGCGSGRHAQFLADSYREVVAADLSPALVETARLRRSHARVRYEARDLHDIADDDGFDLVISIATLHHVPDLGKALRHLRSLVRPGGTAILVDNVSGRPTPPRWAYLTGAAYELPRDILRLGARDAWWLYRFRTSRPWLAHLLSDRYLTRTGFERRYREVFPEARFTDLDFAHAMIWHHPAVRRDRS
ncbi:methyltransferase domain-containing protein [Yinghuangia sp. ASG 101]|uniref:class I SAM-dependent methyltransferase n=1 Tax=Yinghuangia sp. ASG 101 TaxID=2896848 RepID=UPI001E28B384|nr:class I SAM-dependent methyltransferase [Yinghuangia sp. ASG 101]UGQ12875.1 methyltransferase domain-containing protein [Yinghuangia sp. ASG 101]